MYTSALRIAAVIACILSIHATAHAKSIDGRVIAIDRGQPVAGALVRLSFSEGTIGPRAISVFTDEQGRFVFPEDTPDDIDGAELVARHFGFRQTRDIRVDSGQLKDGDTELTIYLEPIAIDYALAPPSAYLSSIPDSPEKDLTILQCTGCHQFPDEKVRLFVDQVEALGKPNGSGDADEQQRRREVVRSASWRMSIKYMRAKGYTSVFSEDTDIKLSAVPWEVVHDSDFSMFTDQQIDDMVEFLTEQYPYGGDGVEAIKNYSLGADIGANAETVIREYAWPDSHLVREATMVRGSPYIWGVDIEKNNLVRIDPQSGHLKWYRVPFEGPTGPHTILGDEHGNVWISMFENNLVARFVPQSESWKLWSLVPTGTEKVMGGEAMVHDLAYGHDGEIRFDKRGNMWMTLPGFNMLGSLNPDSGDVARYDAPTTEGYSGINILLYGAVMAPDGECVWFTQLHGYVGCFDTETLEVEHLVDVPPGSGPRRMAIQDDGTLWVPLFGSGKLMKFDTNSRTELGLYELPDRSSAPYAAAWDFFRGVVWIAASNADLLYRFDPESETFTVYPLPRAGSYARQIGIDPESGLLIGTYSIYPAGAGPSMVFTIDPGNASNK